MASDLVTGSVIPTVLVSVTVLETTHSEVDIEMRVTLAATQDSALDEFLYQSSAFGLVRYLVRAVQQV
jgi:hypothetical protein